MAFEHSVLWIFPLSGIFLYNNESYEFSLPKNSLHNIVLLWLLNILKFGLSHIPEFPLHQRELWIFTLLNILFITLFLWLLNIL